LGAGYIRTQTPETGISMYTTKTKLALAVCSAILTAAPALAQTVVTDPLGAAAQMRQYATQMQQYQIEVEQLATLNRIAAALDKAQTPAETSDVKAGLDAPNGPASQSGTWINDGSVPPVPVTMPPGEKP
jgi:hypothetical protein